MRTVVAVAALVAAIGAVAAPQAFGARIELYNTGIINKPIPDLGKASSKLFYPLSATITSNFYVGFRIDHTYDSNLKITLVSPAGTKVLLVRHRGGDGDNFGTNNTDCNGSDITLLNDGGTPLSTGVAPFVGTFQPEHPLSALDGQDAYGTWKLVVRDTVAGNAGTLVCWGI